jgi:hypothetical protein
MQWNGSFWPKISTIFAFRLDRLIRYSSIKECNSILLKDSNYRPYRVWEVVLLIVCWNFEYLNSLSLRDTHRFKKSKYWNIAHLSRYKRNTFRRVNPGSLIRLLRDEESSEWKPMYGIELPTSIRIISVEAVENLGDFKHINSLTRRDTWYDISKIKHVQDTRW